jgi:hypothetical protein
MPSSPLAREPDVALTLEVETDEILPLGAYLEELRQLDPRDVDGVIASAPRLRALVNDRGFLIDELNRCLGDADRLTRARSAQSLLLGGRRDLLLRANMWIPPSELPELRRLQPYFSYLAPHDHNWHFLTAGYWGSGYRTTIYEYDPDSVFGAADEQVTLRFLERTALPVGKVMFYRASRDVHAQEHPDEFSISLNLMMTPPELTVRDQLLFDFERSVVTRPLASSSSHQSVLYTQLARHLGNATTSGLLERLAAEHPTPRVRLSAYESWAARCRGDEERVWRRATDDAHEAVRSAAHATLRRFER